MPRLFCLLFAASLLFPGILAAQAPVKVTGVVKQFDAKTGTITVRAKGAVEDESYSLLKKDIEVTTIAGEKTPLDFVKPGQTVQMTIGSRGDVEAIVVQPPMFVATVKDIDPKNRTIAIARPENQLAGMPVAAKAEVLLAGRPAYLREVKAGSEMTVTTSFDGKTVLGLKLLADPDGKHANNLNPRVKMSKLAGSKLFGVMTDVDVERREIRVSGPKTKYVPKAMPVSKDAIIQVMYWQVPVQEITLKQVVKMTNATVVQSENSEVTRILLDAPTARAKVRLLDGEDGRLTVEVDGVEITFALGRGFRVMNGTRVLRLMDLQPDRAVSLVLSLDRQQLVAVDVR